MSKASTCIYRNKALGVYDQKSGISRAIKLQNWYAVIAHLSRYLGNYVYSQASTYYPYEVSK